MQRTVITNPQDLKQWWSKVGEKLAVDTETSSLDWYTLDCLGLSFCDGRRACYVNLHNNPKHEELVALLRDRLSTAKKLIFHNAVFDLKVLAKLCIETTEDIFCTMVAHYLLDENDHHGLKYLANKFLRAQTRSYEAVVEEFGVAHPKFAEYATNDAIWTWQLHELFAPRLRAENLWSLFHDVEMPFQFVIADMEMTGIRVDQEKLSRLTETLRLSLRTMKQELYDLGGIEYYKQSSIFSEESEIISSRNLNSPQQLAGLLQELGLEVPTKTEWKNNKKVTKTTTESKALKSLSYHPFVAKLLEYRTAAKLYSSFLKPLPGFICPDGRLRPNFNQVVTVSGRLSSSRPNFQNQPKDGKGPVDVREVYITDEGKVLLAADFSGQEICGLAEVSRDPTLIEAIYKGQDIHLTVANRLFNLGIPDQHLITTHPQYEATKKKYGDHRTKTKAVNFGLCYGETAYGFALDWNTTKEEAQEFIDSYFDKYPYIKKAIEDTKQELDRNGYVVDLAGRRRRFPALQHTPKKKRGRFYRQGFNFKEQGPGASQTKAAGVALRRLFKEYSEWHARIVAQIHDEYLIEIRKEWAHEAKPLIAEVMVKATPWDAIVPYSVSVGEGKSYSEAK